METSSIGVFSISGKFPTMNSAAQNTPMDMALVGVRLDAIRAATGLSKGEFADTVQIDRSSYSKIIKGEKPLKIEMGFIVSERWGVSLDFLYKGNLQGLPESLSKTIIASLT